MASGSGLRNPRGAGSGRHGRRLQSPPGQFKSTSWRNAQNDPGRRPCASAQEQYRFRLEAEAAARLRHPNVVPVYEVGEYAGQPYFVMEFIEGGSLDRYVTGRPQPATEAAELIRSLALAVQHAHDQKIIHRDLKPANILLQRKSETRNPKSEKEPHDKFSDFGFGISDFSPPGFGFRISDFSPKVTDFGLAKSLDAQSTAVTQEGAVLGTAGYMAPEQAAGRVRELGGRRVDVMRWAPFCMNYSLAGLPLRAIPGITRSNKCCTMSRYRLRGSSPTCRAIWRRVCS